MTQTVLTETPTTAAWRSSPLRRGGDVGILILRVALGAVFIGHGSQKLFGWFGGFGLEGTGGFFASLGANPGYFWALVVGLVEFFGGLALIVGLLARLAALALAVDMVVAIALFKWNLGFWETTGGWEYNLILAASLIAVMLIGAGAISVSAAASKRQGRIPQLVSEA